MGRVKEIRELTRVRVLSFLREPEAVFWVFVFPLVLAAVLGFAFRRGGVDPSLIAVVAGPESPALVAALEEADHVEIESFATHEEAFDQLRRAKVDGLVEQREGEDAPTLMFDPTRNESATAELRVRRALALAVPGATEAPLSIDEVTETGSRYVDFLFPGLLGMNLMGTGMWGIGFAMADVRRKKFLKRLMCTPMRKSSFFLGFILSRLVFLVLELAVLVGFAKFVLGVPFEGDIISFAIICFVGAATFAGLGILVASRARTIEGVSGLMNLVMMPMWLASGVFFSYEKFPEVIHPVLQLLPLTALNDSLRAVMLDGASVFSCGKELVVMGVCCVVSIAVALRIFRWS